MKLLRFVFIPLLVVLFLSKANAQDKQSEGARFILHPTVDVTKDWYVALWGITNVRTEIPDNVNLFAGVGKRIKGGYIEAMYWQQWTAKGKRAALDFRLQKQFGKNWSVYFEPSAFLSQKGMYEFLIVERTVTKRLALGGETENTHLLGKKDSWGGGPRASTVLYQNQNFKLVLAGTYQFRNDINTARAYLAAHFRIPRIK